MNVLRSLESKLSGLVEGTFGRVFRSEVQPMEIAHKLAREMDAHRTVSVSRVYAPNEYTVWLSADDRARYEGVEGDVIDELAGYLLEHARREDLALASRPLISFETDGRLSLGEFGIQARLVRGGERDDEALEQAEHGHTMVYSTAERTQAPLEAAREARGRRALLVLDGRRMLVPPRGAVVGRSRDCDVVVSDANVSRHHAELRPRGDGWAITDLGSTNGVRVNGSRIGAAHPLSAGDRIELGSTEMVFEEQ
jgi:FHA domain-containing protein